MSLTYLVSGANRGIGLGLVTALAGRPNTTVFAGARNPAAATDLNALAAKHPNNLHVLKLVSGDKPGNLAAVEEIRKKAGKLDVVIANAGIGDFFASTLEMKPEEMTRHFDVNVNGTLVLFQATYPLLKESPVRKFVPIGSLVGSVSIGSQFPARMLAYGASKAALHYLTRKIYQEHPDLSEYCFRCYSSTHSNAPPSCLRRQPGRRCRDRHGHAHLRGRAWHEGHDPHQRRGLRQRDAQHHRRRDPRVSRRRVR
uniref:NAD(P)-binding protein n=1 Tax=Schizophyllum commune (strain H4-8 / FGSC 9210) TaxID=578458 RepID=D8PW40_SCHCM